MNATPVFPESGNTSQRIGVWKVVVYLLQEQSRDAIPLSRACGQPAVIAEVVFAQSARKKPLLPSDERAWIESSRAEFNQFAINEVTDFDRGDRRLWDSGDDANVN